MEALQMPEQEWSQPPIKNSKDADSFEKNRFGFVSPQFFQDRYLLMKQLHVW
jgi:hypothetical protein